MANHGAIAVGADLDGAVNATRLLEWAATVYWRAAAVGTPRVLDAAQREAVVAAALGRRVRRHEARARPTTGGPMTEMRAIALGVHVLDVLVRPVEQIPEGQGGQLVEEIRMTAAGSAGGAALILAKLGATVQSAGAIGADALGDQLVALLERDGVDTSLLVRRDEVQTSASVLPIRPDGSRPAFHVIGANGTYGPDDAPVGGDRTREPSPRRRTGVHGRRGGGTDLLARA